MFTNGGTVMKKWNKILSLVLIVIMVMSTLGIATQATDGEEPCDKECYDLLDGCDYKDEDESKDILTDPDCGICNKVCECEECEYDCVCAICEPENAVGILGSSMSHIDLNSLNLLADSPCNIYWQFMFDYKMLVVNGDATINGTIPNGVTLIIEKDATLTIPHSSALFNNGKIENYGVLTNNGVFESNQIFYNIGTIANNSPMKNHSEFINKATISNSCVIENFGTITNTGDISNVGTIINSRFFISPNIDVGHFIRNETSVSVLFEKNRAYTLGTNTDITIGTSMDSAVWSQGNGSEHGIMVNGVTFIPVPHVTVVNRQVAGDFYVSGGVSDAWYFDTNQNSLIITDSTNITISNRNPDVPTTHNIIIVGNLTATQRANIALNNVNIEAQGREALYTSINTSLFLQEQNRLISVGNNPGVVVEMDTSFTIGGDGGILYVRGYDGIRASSSTEIEIDEGRIIAVSYVNGYGINGKLSIIGSGQSMVLADSISKQPTMDGGLLIVGDVTHNMIQGRKAVLSAGSFDVTGELSPTQSIEVMHGATLNIPYGLTFENRGNISGLGNMQNMGSMLNLGSVQFDGRFSNQGEICNLGSFILRGFTENKGLFDNQSIALLANFGIFTNAEKLVNQGSLVNELTFYNNGLITNEHSIHNKNFINNNGEIINRKNIIISGILENYGDIICYSGNIIINDGLFVPSPHLAQWMIDDNMKPTATSITSGQTLSESQLLGGGSSLEFRWTNPTLVPSVGTSNQQVYTRHHNTRVYCTTNFSIPITVNAPLVKSVSVGLQDSGITAGVPGYVTFPVTTQHIANGDWSITIANLPQGVTFYSNITLQNDAGWITLVFDTETIAGLSENLILFIDGVASNPFQLEIKRPVLQGTVNITGTPRFGGILNAVTSNLHASPDINLGEMSYQWFRGTDEIIGATSSTYIIVQADIGHTIHVRVTSQNTCGMIQSASTSPISKADATAVPSIPVLHGIPAPTSITIQTQPGVEYAISTQNIVPPGSSVQWIGAISNTLTFTSLAPNTQYFIFARFSETNTHESSLPSIPLEVFTTQTIIPEPSIQVGEQYETIVAGNPVVISLPVNSTLIEDGSHDVVMQGHTTGLVAIDSIVIVDGIGILHVYVQGTVPSGVIEGLTLMIGDTVSYPFTITVDIPTLSGEVLILGEAIYGETLEAEIRNMSSNSPLDLGEKLFRWFRDGVVIEGATSGVYTLTLEDVGHHITVQISTVDTQGVITSPPTNPVLPAENYPPDGNGGDDDTDNNGTPGGNNGTGDTETTGDGTTGTGDTGTTAGTGGQGTTGGGTTGTTPSANDDIDEYDEYDLDTPDQNDDNEQVHTGDEVEGTADSALEETDETDIDQTLDDPAVPLEQPNQLRSIWSFVVLLSALVLTAVFVLYFIQRKQKETEEE